MAQDVTRPLSLGDRSDREYVLHLNVTRFPGRSRRQDPGGVLHEQAAPDPPIRRNSFVFYALAAFNEFYNLFWFYLG